MLRWLPFLALSVQIPVCTCLFLIIGCLLISTAQPPVLSSSSNSAVLATASTTTISHPPTPIIAAALQSHSQPRQNSLSARSMDGGLPSVPTSLAEPLSLPIDTAEFTLVEQTAVHAPTCKGKEKGKGKGKERQMGTVTNLEAVVSTCRTSACNRS
jgi:hypothetical protein